MRQLIMAVTMLFATVTFGQTWKTFNYVDEFGDPTDKQGIAYVGEGVFSNSATTGSNLIIKIVTDLEPDSTSIQGQIRLFEYGRSEATLTYSGSEGTFKVKREDGTVEHYKAWASDSGGIWFYRDFYDLLHQGKKEKIQIVVSERQFSDYGRSIYIFSVITR